MRFEQARHRNVRIPTIFSGTSQTRGVDKRTELTVWHLGHLCKFDSSPGDWSGDAAHHTNIAVSPEHRGDEYSRTASTIARIQGHLRSFAGASHIIALAPRRATYLSTRQPSPEVMASERTGVSTP